MYNHIDIEFMRRLAPQLEQFKEKGNHLFNFRCPYCGDSKTSKVKARGYVFQKKNDYPMADNSEWWLLPIEIFPPLVLNFHSQFHKRR